MFSTKFVYKLAEQVGVAAVGAFAATLAASDGSISKAALVAGLAAAVRAVYGVVVSNFGVPETPSVK